MIDRRRLSWQDIVVVSWAGMRGVVTLAAAAAIQVTTVSGAPFPRRATIQAVAFVTVGTLLIQGWTLLAMIPRLRRRPSARTTTSSPARRPSRPNAYWEVMRAQRAALIEQRDTGGIDEEAVRTMLERLDLQEAAVSARLDRRL